LKIKKTKEKKIENIALFWISHKLYSYLHPRKTKQTQSTHYHCNPNVRLCTSEMNISKSFVPADHMQMPSFRLTNHHNRETIIMLSVQGCYPIGVKLTRIWFNLTLTDTRALLVHLLRKQTFRLATLPQKGSA